MTIRTARALLALACLAPAALAQPPYAPPGLYYPAPQYRPAPAPAYGDGPAAFLSELNAWRARFGRGPLAWDAGLAAFASTNAGVHQPGSSGGAGQCWAGVGGYLAALRMWEFSPAHAAILLNARSVVGCSPCPSGMTANAR